MLKFRKYIPGFVSGAVLWNAEYATTEEMLKDPRFKQTYVEHGMLSKSRDEGIDPPGHYFLMCTYLEVHKTPPVVTAYVVGFVDVTEDSVLDLPDFIRPAHWDSK